MREPAMNPPVRERPPRKYPDELLWSSFLVMSQVRTATKAVKKIKVKTVNINFPKKWKIDLGEENDVLNI
jgi:hypothetical protein